MTTQSIAHIPLHQLDLTKYTNTSLCSKEFLYTRAMKIFYLSFAGYEDVGPNARNLYQRNLNDYRKFMLEVFELQSEPQNCLQVINGKLNNAVITMEIGVIKAQGIENLRNCRVRVLTTILETEESKELILNSATETQDCDPYRRNINIDNLKQIRTANKTIVIQFLADSGNYNEFRLNYRAIHVEGFMDWFDFGNGVRLLVRVRFKVMEFSFGIKCEQIHRLFIMYILQNRIKAFATSGVQLKNKKVMKNEIIQERIDETVDTQWAYWSEAIPQGLKSEMQLMFANLSVGEQSGREKVFFNRFKAKRLPTQRVKYNDLHVTNIFSYQFVESQFCVCNEWCNLHAFLYHNPIARFLLVQHNQLYLKEADSIAIPDVYMLVITHLLTTSSVRTPLIDLLYSAKEFSSDAFIRQLSDVKLSATRGRADPVITEMNATAYKLIRYDLDLLNVIITTHSSIFNDSMVKSIISYFSVYEYLHNSLATKTHFVPNYLVKEWYKEYSNSSRQVFCNLYRVCFDTTINAEVLVYEDILFDENYDTFVGLEKMAGIERVVEHRNRLRQPVSNPYNCRFITGKVLTLIVTINDTLVRMASVIPTDREVDSYQADVDLYVHIDRNLCAKLMTMTDLNELMALLVDTGKQLPLPEHVMYKYYTLKCYAYAYSLQTMFQRSQFNYCHLMYNNRVCATELFEFVYSNDWIETSIYGKHWLNLFDFDNENLDNAFASFYAQLWGQSAHEINLLLTPTQVFEVVLEKYVQLYLWWKVDGDRRLVFRKIMSCKTLIDNALKCVQNIYRDDIITVLHIDNIEYECKTEVLDTCVYWLMRGLCFMIVKIAAKFVKQIDAMIYNVLVQRGISFTHYKPGLVPLFRTLHHCFLAGLSIARQEYISLDDEFGRIDALFAETKTSLKWMFRVLYRKLVINWSQELIFMATRFAPTDILDMLRLTRLISLHVSVGAAIMVAFRDDFRWDYRHLRVWLASRVWHYRNRPNASLYVMTLSGAWNTAELWFADRAEIARAVPLRSQLWIDYFRVEFAEFDNTYDLTQFDININEPDLALVDD